MKFDITQSIIDDAFDQAKAHDDIFPCPIEAMLHEAGIEAIVNTKTIQTKHNKVKLPPHAQDFIAIFDYAVWTNRLSPTKASRLLSEAKPFTFELSDTDITKLKGDIHHESK